MLIPDLSMSQWAVMPRRVEPDINRILMASCHAAGMAITPVRIAWANIPWIRYTSRLALPISAIIGFNQWQNLDIIIKQRTNKGNRKRREKYL